MSTSSYSIISKTCSPECVCHCPGESRLAERAERVQGSVFAKVPLQRPPPPAPTASQVRVTHTCLRPCARPAHSPAVGTERREQQHGSGAEGLRGTWGHRGGCSCSGEAAGAGTVPKASGRGTGLSGPCQARMTRTEGGSVHPGTVRRLRLFAVLIVSVNTVNARESRT